MVGSEDFKRRRRRSEKDFTRHRVLTFVGLVVSQINLMSRSLSVEVSRFVARFLGPELECSKQAYSKVMYGLATFDWRLSIGRFVKALHLAAVDRRVLGASLKRAAVGLSCARGSVKEAAGELGVDPGRLSKWRQKGSFPAKSREGLSEAQKKTKRLRKELREAQLERGAGAAAHEQERGLLGQCRGRELL